MREGGRPEEEGLVLVTEMVKLWEQTQSFSKRFLERLPSRCLTPNVQDTCGSRLARQSADRLVRDLVEDFRLLPGVSGSLCRLQNTISPNFPKTNEAMQEPQTSKMPPP